MKFAVLSTEDLNTLVFCSLESRSLLLTNVKFPNSSPPRERSEFHAQGLLRVESSMAQDNVTLTMAPVLSTMQGREKAVPWEKGEALDALSGVDSQTVNKNIPALSDGSGTAITRLEAM
ncbi:hypothetical protein [Sinorhizobium sp. BG8]|uniref:hypothetical protein n=1 Tax=Sinorhizobium sp. BG8 TaxID=2613773 RepID=UPI00193E138B|nr:hypothetical protein [Sinorhizobium sp. BG8]QRM54395.1 hypothetical protein F3Y30_07430 [Sinorhizobium sp. BG8]